MIKRIQLADCPNCGERPTVYTWKMRDGSSWHHIGCMTSECQVHTALSGSLAYAIRAWNSGHSLRRFDGGYYDYDGTKTRQINDMGVDV